MSQENSELVRRFYEDASARTALPAEFFAPDCVTDWTQVSPDFGVLHGVEASQMALASYFETFDDYRVAAEEVVRAAGDRIVIAVRDSGRIRRSGAEVSNRDFHAWTLRAGKLVRLSSHPDRDKALKAVGLEA
jgi:ketosteroid isomerase-like protein